MKNAYKERSHDAYIVTMVTNADMSTQGSFGLMSDAEGALRWTGGLASRVHEERVRARARRVKTVLHGVRNGLNIIKHVLYIW